MTDFDFKAKCNMLDRASQKEVEDLVDELLRLQELNTQPHPKSSTQKDSILKEIAD